MASAQPKVEIKESSQDGLNIRLPFTAVTQEPYTIGMLDSVHLDMVSSELLSLEHAIKKCFADLERFIFMPAIALSGVVSIC